MSWAALFQHDIHGSLLRHCCCCLRRCCCHRHLLVQAVARQGSQQLSVVQEARQGPQQVVRRVVAAAECGIIDLLSLMLLSIIIHDLLSATQG